MARSMVEEVLRSMPKVLEQQLKNSHNRMDFLKVAASEEETAAGTKETISPSEAENGTNDVRRIMNNYSNTGCEGKYTPYTVAEIKDQNKHRKKNRDKWRGSGDYEHLADPWRNIRRGNEPLFDKAASAERKGLQLALIDALHQLLNEASDAYQGRADSNLFVEHSVQAQGPSLDLVEDLNIDWSMPISSAEEQMRVNTHATESGVSTGPFYHVSDFSLHDLQTLGQHEVYWIPYWDEHLALETKGRAIILKLYWVSPSLASGLEMEDLVQRAEEILRTLDMVLNPNYNPGKSKKQYEQLKAPEWLSLTAYQASFLPAQYGAFSEPLSRFQADPTLDRPKYCCEIEDHMKPHTIGPIDERVTKFEFPCYYQQLKELRSFMDSRQTKGIRDLWRDSRGSNYFITTWLVTIFGALGVLLGFFTLVVAIVQAWGQLQTLHQ
ncbi:MAG: hypothetical protein Q9221_008679 [Calogaya cf. arnoldii]